MRPEIKPGRKEAAVKKNTREMRKDYYKRFCQVIKCGQHIWAGSATHIHINGHKYHTAFYEKVTAHWHTAQENTHSRVRGEKKNHTKPTHVKKKETKRNRKILLWTEVEVGKITACFGFISEMTFKIITFTWSFSRHLVSKVTLTQEKNISSKVTAVKVILP